MKTAQQNPEFNSNLFDFISNELKEEFTDVLDALDNAIIID